MPYAISQPGESIAYVAWRHGYAGDAVWNHPENKHLHDIVRDKDDELPGKRAWLPDFNPTFQTGHKTGQVLSITVPTKPIVNCNICHKPLRRQPRSNEDHPGCCPYMQPESRGTNRGSGPTLRHNMWAGEHENHPWWVGSGSLQTHHIIPSKAVKTPDWERACKRYVYDINRKENGVMLPAQLALACHLAVPLHRGHHDNDPCDYTNQVSKQIAPRLAEATDPDACSSMTPEAFASAMDEDSAAILTDLALFDMLITSDGEDYMHGHSTGCANEENVGNKKVDTVCKVRNAQPGATEPPHYSDPSILSLTHIDHGVPKPLLPNDGHARE